ncbi:MAG: DUF4115 domain-containing protein [Desulfovibrio sp.]|jgi:cytoskeleton protein RodZ|nr:DUF4115 domain-containing protein [Desulfovibrio sp.]
MLTPFQVLGDQIREKRESMGLSIDDVSSRIKISTRILKSIEEGSHVGLPHDIYTKNFIRSFGLVVGCDPEDLNAQLEEIFPRASFDGATHVPVFNRNAGMAYPGTARRVFVLLIILILLGGFAGGCWYVSVYYGTWIIEMVKKPFSAFTEEHSDQPAQPTGGINSGGPSLGLVLSSLLPSAVGNAAPTDGNVEKDRETRNKGAAPGASPPLDLSSDPAASNNASVPAPPAIQAGVDASAVQSEADLAVKPDLSVVQGNAPIANATLNTTTALPGGKNQVLIRGREACWLSSRADGAKGREYILKNGEIFVLTYNNALEISLGNAGGVDIEHNGKKFDVPGRKGQKLVLHFPPKPR